MRPSWLMGMLALSAPVALAGCEFSLSTKGATTPQNGVAPQTTQPGVTPVLAAPKSRIGRRGAQPTTPVTPTPVTPTPTTPTTPVTPVTPSTPGTLTAANAFGSGTPAEIKCNVYFIAEGAQKVPALDTLTPNGFLFAKTLNVSSRTFEEGFPGLDPVAGTKRNTNFALRCEWPINVTADATYEFSLTADDGALFYIDDTLLVDNDGAHTATEKKGPVRILPGTHYARLDYYQGSSPTVALQLMVTPPKGTATPAGSTL